MSTTWVATSAPSPMAKNKRPPPKQPAQRAARIQAPARTGSKESRPRSKFSRDKIRDQVRLVDVFCYHCGERFDERRAKNGHYGRWCKDCGEGHLSRFNVDTAKTVVDRFEIINAEWKRTHEDIGRIMQDRERALDELRKLHADHQAAVAAKKTQEAQRIRDAIFALADINQDDDE